jgi:uncharacterized protein YfaS (alpha-2-macroglobulin family)
LTTWRLTAVAVTRDTRLGVANSEVVTSKPLLLRPLTPRFLVGGDALTLGAIVHNTTASELAVTGRLSASGVLLRGDPARSIDVPAGGQARLDWPVTSTVGQTGQAKLHFEVAGAGPALTSAAGMGRIEHRRHGRRSRAS